jgi:hypothetical protein
MATAMRISVAAAALASVALAMPSPFLLQQRSKWMQRSRDAARRHAKGAPVPADMYVPPCRPGRVLPRLCERASAAGEHGRCGRWCRVCVYLRVHIERRHRPAGTTTRRWITMR